MKRPMDREFDSTSLMHSITSNKVLQQNFTCNDFTIFYILHGGGRGEYSNWSLHSVAEKPVQLQKLTQTRFIACQVLTLFCVFAREAIANTN